MIWFFAIVCLAIVVLVAVVATGWGGGLPEVFDDRPDSRVQADRPLTAADLVHVRFSSSLRGYRMSEVDTLLDRLAQEMGQREAAGPRTAAAEMATAGPGSAAGDAVQATGAPPPEPPTTGPPEPA